MRASDRTHNVAIISHSSLLNANRRPKTIPPAWKPAAGINPKNNKLPIRCSSEPGANAAAIPKNTDITERKLLALKVAKPSSAVCRLTGRFMVLIVTTPGTIRDARLRRRRLIEIHLPIDGHLEKFLSPSRHESDSVTARGHGRMERAGHGAEGLFRC